jgi:hypothetical protein
LPPGQPGVIADFETFGTWRRGDQPNGTFTQSGDKAHQGRYSGKLDYQFDTTGNDYVVFAQAHVIDGEPARLTAWVYGDGSGHFLNAWIRDADGQVWQVPLGTVGHSGWQEMAGLLDATQPWPWSHISGPDNGQIDYPVAFSALVLDDKPDSFSGSGSLYIDELRAEGGTAPGPTAEGGTAAGPTAEPPAGPTGAPPGAQTVLPTGRPPAAPVVSGRIAYSAAGHGVVHAHGSQYRAGRIAAAGASRAAGHRATQPVERHDQGFSGKTRNAEEHGIGQALHGGRENSQHIQRT